MKAPKSKRSTKARELHLYVGTISGEISHSRNGGDSCELHAAHLPHVLSLEASVV